jgi:hypothetical protein
MVEKGSQFSLAQGFTAKQWLQTARYELRGSINTHFRKSRIQLYVDNVKIPSLYFWTITPYPYHPYHPIVYVRYEILGSTKIIFLNLRKSTLDNVKSFFSKSVVELSPFALSRTRCLKSPRSETMPLGDTAGAQSVFFYIKHILKRLFERLLPKLHRHCKDFEQFAWIGSKIFTLFLILIKRFSSSFVTIMCMSVGGCWAVIQVSLVSYILEILNFAIFEHLNFFPAGKTDDAYEP